MLWEMIFFLNSDCCVIPNNHWDQTIFWEESVMGATESRDPVKVITVALVGDSITEGYGVDPSESYPTKLVTILKERLPTRNFEVLNLGHSGATLCEVGRPLRYRDTQVYSVLSDSRPDLIFLMLGTNDSAFSVEEKSFETTLKKFVVELLNLVDKSISKKERVDIAHLLGSDRRKRLVLMIPPPIYVSGNKGGKKQLRFIQTVIPQTIRSVSSSYGLADPIDLFAHLGGTDLSLPQMFSDCLHPNAQGFELIAQKVAERIVELCQN